MLRKLYSLVSGATCADNPDSPQHHEVLLPGFLYGMIIKERFEEALNGVKAQITQDIRQKKDKPFTDRKLFTFSAGASADNQPNTSTPCLQRPTGTSELNSPISLLLVISSRHPVSICNRHRDIRL